MDYDQPISQVYKESLRCISPYLVAMEDLDVMRTVRLPRRSLGISINLVTELPEVG